MATRRTPQKSLCDAKYQTKGPRGARWNRGALNQDLWEGTSVRTNPWRLATNSNGGSRGEPTRCAVARSCRLGFEEVPFPPMKHSSPSAGSARHPGTRKATGSLSSLL